MAYDVAVMVGSLRRESWTRKVAQAMIDLAPASLDCEIVDWSQVQVFNPELNEHAHASAGIEQHLDAVIPISCRSPFRTTTVKPIGISSER